MRTHGLGKFPGSAFSESRLNKKMPLRGSKRVKVRWGSFRGAGAQRGSGVDFLPWKIQVIESMLSWLNRNG